MAEVKLSAHAEKRMKQRRIRPEFLLSALRIGERDRDTQEYGGIPVYKQRYQDLVVVCAANPAPACDETTLVLTAYWRAGVPDRRLFREGGSIDMQRKCSLRRLHRTNRSWQFWNAEER